MQQMQNRRERGSFLRELYERKFYNINQSQGVLDKVLNFQRKIQDFKINRTHSIRNQEEVPLLQDGPKILRPSTHVSCSRPSKFKYSSEKTTFQMEGPARAQLRLILNSKNQGEQGLLTQNIKERNLYSMHQYRKKRKLSSQKASGRHQTVSEQKSRLTPVDMKHFYEEIPILESDKRAKPIIYHLKANSNEEATLELEKRPRSVSRKVMIGGRDLQKAAEEYYKNFKQTNKHIESQKKQAIKDQLQRQRQSKTSGQKKRLRFNSSRHSSRKSVPLKKQKKGEQPKNYQDIYNQELKPWNVDIDNFP